MVFWREKRASGADDLKKMQGARPSFNDIIMQTKGSSTTKWYLKKPCLVVYTLEVPKVKNTTPGQSN